jgi:hypothetical protein
VASTHPARVQLARRTHVPGGLLVRWARMCELLRLPDFTLDMVELLAAAGVPSATALLRQKAVKLAPVLSRVNKLKKLVESPPEVADIEAWQKAARTLGPLVK